MCWLRRLRLHCRYVADRLSGSKKHNPLHQLLGTPRRPDGLSRRWPGRHRSRQRLFRRATRADIDAQSVNEITSAYLLPTAQYNASSLDVKSAYSMNTTAVPDIEISDDDTRGD